MKIAELTQSDISSLKLLNYNFVLRWLNRISTEFTDLFDDDYKVNLLIHQNKIDNDYYTLYLDSFITSFICFNSLYSVYDIIYLNYLHHEIEKERPDVHYEHISDPHEREVSEEQWKAYNLRWKRAKKLLKSQEDGYGAKCQILNFYSDNKILDDLEVEYIVSKMQEHNLFVKKENDRDRFINALRNNNISKSNGATMELIYGIRCNIFHGKKEYAEANMSIVKPLSLVLYRIINELIKKLERYQVSAGSTVSKVSYPGVNWKEPYYKID